MPDSTLLASRLALLAALAPAPLAPVHAQAFYENPQVFTLARDCVATTSIRKKTNPVALNAGSHVVALGENKFPGGTHAFVEVCGERKWLDLACGQLQQLTDSGRDNGEGGDDDEPLDACLDFFDNEDNPLPGIGDVTPPPPVLNAFDRAIMKVCGAPGKVVKPEEFHALLAAHPAVLDRIEHFTGGRVYGNRPPPDSPAAYLEQLTDAWFKIKAFDHILCGQPEPGGMIGGLHFHGRYLALQELELACRLEDTGRTEVVDGVIYSMPVRMQVRGGFAQSPIKGFGLTLNAEELLKLVTRAFAENPTASSNSTGCLLEVTDKAVSGDDEVRFTTVFVRRANGIRTFYPDATPNGPGDHDNPRCSQAIDLTE